MINKQIMNTDTKKKLESWLCNYPESEHPLDMERFYEFVSSIIINEDSLCEFGKEDLVNYLNDCQPKWNKHFKNEFADEWTLKIELCVNLLKHIHYII